MNWILVFSLLALAPQAGAAEKATVAMTADKGAPVYANEIFSVGKDPVKLVDKLNAQIELAPYSVVEFNGEAELKLMRGSALVESRGERTLQTSSAAVDFNGQVLVSYDHKQRSSSAFVLAGEARMKNPAEPESSLRLDRWRGATLEVGGVLPQLIRQLDFTSLQSWMKGYAWPEKERHRILRGLPEAMAESDSSAPAHLEDTKIEDYFSAIDTGNEADDQPDYYERKFSDPDKVVAEANAVKPSGQKGLRPEEAALITLPSTRIDLGFEVISAEQRARETSQLGKKRPVAKRSIASVAPAPDRPAIPKEASPVEGESGDPEVDAVLERLRGIKATPPVVSSAGRAFSRESRAPASIGPGLVPDPVYDYSENF